MSTEIRDLLERAKAALEEAKTFNRDSRDDAVLEEIIDEIDDELLFRKARESTNTPKHSPWPWTDAGTGMVTHPGSGSAMATSVVESRDWGRIFEVIDYSNEPLHNFRLILAAPDLLDACKAIVARFRHLSEEEDHWRRNRRNKIEWREITANGEIERIMNAIAKAEGK